MDDESLSLNLSLGSDGEERPCFNELPCVNVRTTAVEYREKIIYAGLENTAPFCFEDKRPHAE